MKVPMRLVECSHYADAALSVYMKVKALGLRAEGCTAGVATIAGYLGFSASTVQRSLAQLRATAPDGVVELPDSRRRSLPGGRGTTARRMVRPLRPTERFIWVPVAASEQLRPRLLRAYVVISYAVAQNIPLTERTLAGFLRHHSGRRAGAALTTEAAGRIIDELVAAGWISVRRRAGFQGRHLFLVHDGRPVPTPAPDDRSGSDAGDRSLAYKEDLKTDRPENDAVPVSPAVGEVPVEEAANDRTHEATPVDAPGDRALRADGTAPPPTSTARDTGQTSWRGPQLTFSPRLNSVLEPVRSLLCQVNTYVQRRIGREVARQLDDGYGVLRLRERLTQRLAQTLVSDIRDPGRWLLGVALPRWGCADPDCESGVLWSTGTRCSACREAVAERASARREKAGHRTRAGSAAHHEPGHDLGHDPGRRPPAVPRIVEYCPDCERPHLPGGAGLCAECRTRSATPSAPPPAPTASIGSGCRGRNGTCGRPAPHGLCWRCRMESGASPPGEERYPPGT
ncbi:hypothetical protein E3E14_28165 [Streptomyces sp. ICN441]|uniref:Uncharacterized protein n=2 Tax=Streptomyces TaxID=1883 RepID=A0A2S1T2G9_9ACTN|nr:hypothetical protein DDW44_31530 [Streptomyces tirandamycinicus]TFE38528.1 hypothetical protein E3E14_28165 [Streptomyces sp. ICN441]